MSTQTITTNFGQETFNDDGSIQFAFKPISTELKIAFELLQDPVFTPQERQQISSELMKTSAASQDAVEILKEVIELRKTFQ